MSVSLFDAQGRRLSLASSLGRGGEAEVFAVEGAPTLAAKLYHQPPPPEKARKLGAMAYQASEALTSSAAWPTTTLHRAPGGPLVGLVMPRITEHREVHQLYSPAHRRTAFPDRDWEFLIVVARNLAAVVAGIHAAGHVIGDVNQGNVLVSSKGTVKLIDADSFQIRDGGQWHLCEVGVAHFTPPELQGKSFRGIVRTPNHDAFGLAVLLFHLLFMGRHPFAGRFGGAGDMPIELAITEFRFAFGGQSAQVRMTPPPHSLPLVSASVGIAQLFERAFCKSSAADGARPSAAAWKASLDTLRGELTRCPTLAGHRYHRSLSGCPWCAIEKAGGPNFFISVLITSGGSAGPGTSGFDLDRLWREVLAITEPPGSPPRPVSGSTRGTTRKSGLRRPWVSISPVGSTTPTAGSPIAINGAPLPRHKRVLHRISLVLAWSSVAGALAAFATELPELFGLSFVVLLLALGLRARAGVAAEQRQRRGELKVAEAAYKAAAQRWDREVGPPAKRFRDRLSAANRLRTEYLSLHDLRRAEYQKLLDERRVRQLQQHLDRHYVSNARIRGIGDSLRATLAAFGIETAADIDYRAVLAVPGIGPTRATALVAWRGAVEARFKFDPAVGPDAGAVAVLDRRIGERRAELERLLLAARSELRQIEHAATELRRKLGDALIKAEEAKARAEANLAT